MFRIKFIKIPQNFRKKIWEALVQTQMRFIRNPEKKFGKKNPGRLNIKPNQVQQGSGKGSRKDYGSVWC